jgi:hypothetical protein
VLGKGRAGAALLSGMRPDLWAFPRHSLRESETRPRGEVQCVPRAECAAAMPETTRLPSRPGATDPARLAGFQGSGLTPTEVGACRTPGTATSFPHGGRWRQGAIG